MRFDELTLEDPEGDLHLRFHPALTMVCGLADDDRHTLSQSIVNAAGGGDGSTRLHLTGADGRHIIAVSEDGRLTAHYEDGTTAPTPLGRLDADPGAVRSLMLLTSDDLGVLTRTARNNEPSELREARQMLDELNEELSAALGHHQARVAVQAALDQLDHDLRAAHDGVARREYALVLARLERVRAEASAVDADSTSVESDRHLLASADAARALVRAWTEGLDHVAALIDQLDGPDRLDPEERDALATIPAQPPAGLDALIAELRRAVTAHATLDKRLQALSISKLPAPSDPAVAELGLLDQASLWAAADWARETVESMRSLQLSLGGLEVEEMGAPPEAIAEIETAHMELDAAEAAASEARVRGAISIAIGLTSAAIGAIGVPLLVPLGVTTVIVASVAGFVRPSARRTKAAAAAAQALETAGATSYLGFHIRRVEATIDPELRAGIETTMRAQRAAQAAWVEVGGTVDVDRAHSLRSEIEAYNQALCALGDTADEIEALRHELAGQVEPALASAGADVLLLVEPYRLDEHALDDLGRLEATVAHQCERGAAARIQTMLDHAEVDLEKIVARLEDLLLELGFDDGPLEARAGALDWAIGRAAEREDARRSARLPAEIEADLTELQEAAARLRRPEWAAVTAAEADAPDIAALETKREELLVQLNAPRPDIDTDRLADRRAAVERRVAALEARHSGHAGGTDPAAIAGLREHLLSHLATAATAGPAGDPVPVVLDEVLTRVPADRTWDLLDLLLSVAETHQLIYLSNDAFVAAWAHQRAMDGTVTLLEMAAEPAA